MTLGWAPSFPPFVGLKSSFWKKQNIQNVAALSQFLLNSVINKPKFTYL